MQNSELGLNEHDVKRLKSLTAQWGKADDAMSALSARDYAAGKGEVHREERDTAAFHIAYMLRRASRES